MRFADLEARAGVSMATTAMRLLLAAAVGLPAAAMAQDLDRGHALADRWCGNCHMANRSATSGRSDGLPSLQSIADRPDMTDAKLRGFLSTAHGRMPDLSLGARDQTDLIAYILSLRGK